MLGKENAATIGSRFSLAHLYREQGRYGDAEPLLKEVLAMSERELGAENRDTLLMVQNLASLYEAQGRYGEAEPLLKRAVEASVRVLGEEDHYTLIAFHSLAALYHGQGRYNEAEPLYKRVLAINERVLGKDHPDTLAGLASLADLYRGQGRYGEAELLSKRAVEASVRILGKGNPQIIRSTHVLAALYLVQGRYAEAEPLFKRVLEAQEGMLGKEHPDTLTTVHDLAAVYFEQGDFGRASELWRRSTSAIARRMLRSAEEPGQTASKNEAEAKSAFWQFRSLVQAAYRLAPEGRAPDAELTREMFRTAQWALDSEAARSLARMAARGATGDAKLAELVRQRQDLVGEWQKRDGLRDAALATPAAARNPQAEAENQARLGAIDVQIAGIDKRLQREFPDYASLASPAPLSVEEVQAQLAEDEALVLFLDAAEHKPAPDETFLWVVTKADVRWVRSDAGRVTLAREVLALRCGLDADAWDQPDCEKLTGQNYSAADRDAGKPLPFDLARAHSLYQALFGQVDDLIKGKQLLIVPSGPLTILPFQVLVTAPPKSSYLKSAAWLVRDHALSVLPAVSSIRALRRIARPSAAAKPMIGFGNPLLDGSSSADAQLAQLARENRACPEPLEQRIVQAATPAGGVAQVETRGGLADAALIRKAPPLPETASELCAVARDVHADASDIYLGARATEREVKRLSQNGKLAQYRLVHFATHGALAGQVKGNSEPGLILTPPEQPSGEDDGYLTASEIAALKLDADWVILSARNTAAGGAKDAEALSGLARAFIYAQARALLVSHWAVSSDATVKLVTGALRRMSANRGIGRSEAMRQSMLALIEKGTPEEAHPALWAPFIVVGEGGAAR